jgi:hypothetical protein
MQTRLSKVFLMISMLFSYLTENRYYAPSLIYLAYCLGNHKISTLYLRTSKPLQPKPIHAKMVKHNTVLY